MQRSPTACHQLSSRSMRPAANQILVLSSPGSNRPQPESLIGYDGGVRASNQREEASSSDSVATEVMEALSLLLLLFAIQSHSLFQNILLLSCIHTAKVTFPASLSFPSLSLSILIINCKDKTGLYL